jgi:hypothetical protein
MMVAPATAESLELRRDLRGMAAPSCLLWMTSSAAHCSGARPVRGSHRGRQDALGTWRRPEEDRSWILISARRRPAWNSTSTPRFALSEEAATASANDWCLLVVPIPARISGACRPRATQGVRPGICDTRTRSRSRYLLRNTWACLSVTSLCRAAKRRTFRPALGQPRTRTANGASGAAVPREPCGEPTTA